MLKHYVKKFCKNINFTEKALFYEFYKYELGLPILLNMRLCLYPWISLLLFFFYKYNSILVLILFIVSTLTIFICCLIELKREKPDKLTLYQLRTLKLRDMFLKRITIRKNNVISKKDWKHIKKTNKKLYKKLLGDQSEDLSYYYAREIALILKNVKLMYVAIDDRLHETIYAHALIRKGDQVYDSYLKRSFKLDDYAKLYNMKIYSQWSFKDYSDSAFRRTVKNNFTNWCIKNDVKSYELF